MGKVHGVLTDYDLASWVSPLTPDYTKTSQQRTGTPPFMAHGLLDGTDPVHLYRHDVESLFYIMLILATHYEIQAPTGKERGGVRVREGNLQFQFWFGMLDYATLGEKKMVFSTTTKKFEVSPSFKDFHGWLQSLQKIIGRGLRAKVSFQEGDDDTVSSFDDETLGGRLTYSALIHPVRGLTGELEGLAIRYDPTSRTSVSTTGAGLHA